MVMTLGVSELSAATKKTVKIETTQFITSITCDGCTKKIMNYIPNQKGVEEVKVDLPRKIVTVSYNSSKTNDATLIKKFSKIDINAKVYDPNEHSKTNQSNSKTTTNTQSQSNKSTQQSRR